MTKLELAEILTASPAWDGEKDPHVLVKICTKGQLEDAFFYLEEAEQEYYENIDRGYRVSPFEVI